MCEQIPNAIMKCAFEEICKIINDPVLSEHEKLKSITRIMDIVKLHIETSKHYALK